MDNSLTYLYFPDRWLRPVLDGVLTLAEASELWELTCLLNPDAWIEPPPHLLGAVSRLTLWQMPVDKMVQ